MRPDLGLCRMLVDRVHQLGLIWPTSPMRINTRVRYAIRMMADMAKYGHGEPVRLRDIAARQDLPKMYLSQLTAPLKNAALIKSFWGNRGGYALNRPASEISLLDIIEAVEGPIGLIFS